jgi:hypothetical protein
MVKQTLKSLWSTRAACKTVAPWQGGSVDAHEIHQILPRFPETAAKSRLNKKRAPCLEAKFPSIAPERGQCMQVQYQYTDRQRRYLSVPCTKAGVPRTDALRYSILVRKGLHGCSVHNQLTQQQVQLYVRSHQYIFSGRQAGTACSSETTRLQQVARFSGGFCTG